MKRIRRFFAELRDAIVQAAFSLVSHKLRAFLTISGPVNSVAAPFTTDWT